MKEAVESNKKVAELNEVVKGLKSTNQSQAERIKFLEAQVEQLRMELHQPRKQITPTNSSTSISSLAASASTQDRGSIRSSSHSNRREVSSKI